jgi:hypothetical protein
MKPISEISTVCKEIPITASIENGLRPKGERDSTTEVHSTLNSKSNTPLLIPHVHVTGIRRIKLSAAKIGKWERL